MTITYRPLRSKDMAELQQLHIESFPVRYESSFFEEAISGKMSCLAASEVGSDGSDILIGVITAQIKTSHGFEVYIIQHFFQLYPPNVLDPDVETNCAYKSD